MASLRAALGQSASPLPAGPGCSRWTSLQLQGSRCCFEFARLHRPGQRAHPTVLLHLDCAGVAAARRAYPRIEATARHGSRTENAKVRNRRMQKKFSGTATKPRLSVFCSNKQLYAVLADDHNKKILFYGSTLQQSICGDPPCTTVAARRVGEELVRTCTELGITEISSYDRNGFARGEKMMAFEGFSRNPYAKSCRVGCKAMIRLLRRSDHSWYISQVILEHNHPLSVGCAEKKQWGSHGFIDSHTKDLIRRMRQSKVTIGRVCNIVNSEYNAAGLPGVRKEVIQSVCAALARENIRDDMSKTIQLLQKMRNQDQNPSVTMDLASDGTVRSVLWCSGKNKLDYARFGDVVTFDTTYRTNLYNLPFGLFVGVNNHFQSVVFGGVLLTQETTADFEWAFSNFVEIMGGKVPQTILTDQCQAMKAAICTVLPSTRHRWCRWHVLKKAKEGLKGSYTKNCGFKKFNTLVTDVVCRRQFERQWKRLEKQYGLQENNFLDRAYKFRHMWAKPYFMHAFCAGMTSTKKSESANHMLKSFIPRAAPMHQFVEKFNEFQFQRNEQEGKERHVTKMKSRVSRTGLPIEDDAQSIYARAMSERFYRELFMSGKLVMKEISNGHYLVFDQGLYEAIEVEHTVHFSSHDKSKINCTCGLFEHSGMLCRHALKVLVRLDVREIPKGNIMHRWTKWADNSTPMDASVTGPSETFPTQNKVGYGKTLLALSAFELVKDIDGDAECLTLAFKAIEQARTMIQQRKRIKSTEGFSVQINMGNIATATLPKPPSVRGRPKNTSLKSWKEQQKVAKRAAVIRKNSAKMKPDEDEAAVWARTKSVDEILVSSRQS